LFGGISSLFPDYLVRIRYGLFGTQYKFALAHPGGGLWDKGGWTGAGQDNEIAGAVHKNEYVFSAPATARIGVANLEAMHRSAKGFASGGFVGNLPASMNGGGGVVVNIVNNSGASVQKTERKTAGGTSIDVMIDDAVASNMAKQGSATRKMTQAQFGMRTPLANSIDSCLANNTAASFST